MAESGGESSCWVGFCGEADGEADGVEAGVTYDRVTVSTTVVVVVVVTSEISVPGGKSAGS